MFLIGEDLHWSASDLTAAAECEYAVLRSLDYRLGWAEQVAFARNPLDDHIARIGERHEERLLAQQRATGPVVELERIRPTSSELVRQADDATRAALRSDAAVLYQATFCDGEFYGVADFLELTPGGWQVCDAKLAREAKPRALLQVAAYADQLVRMGVPRSDHAALLLGDGRREEFPLADLMPLFREHRQRLRDLLSGHRAGGLPVAWGDDSIRACGRCDECQHAAHLASDIILVAGLRSDQRLRLRRAGIRSIEDLALATTPPSGVSAGAFERLRMQAQLQWEQLRGGPDAPVIYRLAPSAADTLEKLPAPSPGDLFFDFEGDPLYDEGDPRRNGLEYLWGVTDAAGHYTPTWAHSFVEEREAFSDFVAKVTDARAVHPDMHVYHYAAYETTALKRLGARYQVMQEELDDLLRGEVFVDLYATVRGSIRISASSYSIKKLEPLYMGDQLRDTGEDAVSEGAGSVVAYHEFRLATETGDTAKAATLLASLQDYNCYDCLSTLRLRDWLIARAAEAGVADRIRPRIGRQPSSDETEGPSADAEDDSLIRSLMARSGSDDPSTRTPGEQACAMLASALGFHRREDKQHWWDHYDRMSHPLSDWADTRDVFSVESAEVVADWYLVPRATRYRRDLRLVGDWAPGSTTRASGTFVVSPISGETHADADSRHLHDVGETVDVTSSADDPRVIEVTESRLEDDRTDKLPIALTPGRPIRTKELREAIRDLCSRVVPQPDLPRDAAVDILLRCPPRLGTLERLPSGGAAADDISAALIAMSDSYVAVQGPPGSGKTFTASQVIRELVEKHGWRIGVVAQSHAVVENLLRGVVKTGLDPARVGKSSSKGSRPTNMTWTDVPDRAVDRARFLTSHRDDGCVLGGTAWTFSSAVLADAGPLDLLVIDEAGQFSLAQTIAASRIARRLLLVGDPNQLPQVSTGSHPEPVDDSALGWLMHDHETLPPHLGYFLDRSYRMHPAICEPVSALSYAGRLTSADEASRRNLEGVPPGLDVVMLEHEGNRTESAEEAAVVVAEVASMLGRTWSDPDDSRCPRPLTQDDILVVAPYNAQVSLIQKKLIEAGLHDVRVGTVDRFQGQEAPVAIVSMAASSPGDVPRGMGFLLDRHRINVAVSRAQWRAVIVRSAALTAYLPSTPTGVLELGAFIGLCERG